MEGKRMSNRTFRAILIPIAVVLAFVIIIATIAANMIPSLLDDYLGRGEQHIVAAEGTEDWDTAYYGNMTTDYTVTREKAYKLSARVMEEGSVLLKNNGVLPLAKQSAVTPFGYGYHNPVYGQMDKNGSAKWVIEPVTPETNLKAYFTVNESASDKMKAAPEPNAVAAAEGTTWIGELNNFSGAYSRILEYNPSIYNGIENSVKDTDALVFVTRTGQEGSDKKYDGYVDGTPHYFALSANEKETLRLAKRMCKSVTLIVVSSSAMELTPALEGDCEADAILWVGHPSEKGFDALGKLLTGEVNPSGRTPDIYASDFTKDPSYANFGEFKYDNATVTTSSYRGESTEDRNFIEYEEGVYNGYRYYETADAVDPSFVYGELDGMGGVTEKGAVNYPFGYGLSYTRFKQEIIGFDTSGGDIKVTVKVTNNGSTYTGREVVQIYFSAPYTDFDVTNKIEKPAVQLVDFAKTKPIEPGQSGEVTVTFSKEDLASYCYTRKNPDGSQGCYVLENGDYEISLRKDSHVEIESRVWNNPSVIWYDNTNPRRSEKDAQSALSDSGEPLGYPAVKKSDPDAETGFRSATNLFQSSSDYMNEEATLLSRANWKGTQPTRPENRRKSVSEKYKAMFGTEMSFDPETDARLGNVPTSEVYESTDPVSGKNNGLKVSDMRGKDFYDPAWSDFLDQIDFSEDGTSKIVKLLTISNYSTYELNDMLGLPATVECDGANGIKDKRQGSLGDDGKANDSAILSTASYGYPPLMAATWDVELMYLVGCSMGDEAFAIGFNGWYSPAINLHRSPFSGRNFEYYSEDPILTGVLTSAVVSGAGDHGLFCYIKHFALNDQETNRDKVLNTWADEQTMRELYFKAYEIPVKNAHMTVKYTADTEGTVKNKTMRAATAVMCTQTAIGPTMGHTNYDLVTNLLRGEWGFTGIAHTDMYIWPKTNMYDYTLRAGVDTYLTMEFFSGKMVDTTSATVKHAMRRALHHISYTVANSARMQGIAPGSIVYYDVSPWVIWLTVLNIIIWLAIVAILTLIVLRTVHENRHPEKYNNKKRDGSNV